MKRGGIVAFPTETVYGVAARYDDEKAVAKIFRAKGRPEDNPLIVHISNIRQLPLLAREIPVAAEKLIKRFWPGPLTLIFKKTDWVPPRVTAGLPTVAVRMPSHPVARKLISAAGVPLAAPSANRSGRPSSTRFEHVKKELGGRVDMILDGGKSRHGLESTVVDCTVEPFRLLRPGFVTLENLRSAVRSVAVAKKAGKDSRPRSPGMKHAHYRPACRIHLLSPKSWRAGLGRILSKNKKVGVISLTQKSPRDPKIVFSHHFRNNAHRLANKLYDLFFKAEEKGVKALVVESSLEKGGVRLALMDRLRRASA